MRAVAIGQSPNLKVVKRTVQLIVDRILSDEASMLGLTTIRDYEDQTFTHAVNVCIFSVALGRRLGLSRVQLYDLGLAALFHDCGKSRMPEGILDKTGPLTDEDWKAITAHPWTGVLTLFHLREHNEYPYRAMMVSYEHHLKRDDSGYPKRLRPRPVGFYSKIVAVIEAFDAATTRLGHNDSPTTPAGVVDDDARERAQASGSAGRAHIHRYARRVSGRHGVHARHVRARDLVLGESESRISASVRWRSSSATTRAISIIPACSLISARPTRRGGSSVRFWRP